MIKSGFLPHNNLEALVIYMGVMGLVVFYLWLTLRRKGFPVTPSEPPKADVSPGLYRPDLIIWSQGVFDKGLRYAEWGDYFEAMGEFYRAVEARPRWPEPRYHLGIAYTHLQEMEKAEEQVEALRALNSPLAEELSAYLAAHRPKTR